MSILTSFLSQSMIIFKSKIAGKPIRICVGITKLGITNNSKSKVLFSVLIDVCNVCSELKITPLAHAILVNLSTKVELLSI